MSQPLTAPVPATRLVVNADDFGYFHAVSRGILAAIDVGVVTATGVMANGPAFRDQVGALRGRPEVDVGVHLNLTLGVPLSGELGRTLGGAALPGPARLARGLIGGALPLGALAAELRAQVGRCVDAGLQIRFLNAHEHVHLLPPLAREVARLAREHAIPFVRRVRPEWRGLLACGLPGLARAGLLGLLALLDGPGRDRPGPRLTGVNASGRLDAARLEPVLRGLVAGQDWELMCHPGYRDPAEVVDPRLLCFHHWEAELAALSSPRFRALCQELGVALVRFRDLLPAGA